MQMLNIPNNIKQELHYVDRQIAQILYELRNMEYGNINRADIVNLQMIASNTLKSVRRMLRLL